MFDIETRRVLSYYNLGDTIKFLEGYKYYKDGVKKGLSSVSGKTIEIYYQAYLGNVDKAVRMARNELGDNGENAITNLKTPADGKRPTSHRERRWLSTTPSTMSF